MLHAITIQCSLTISTKLDKSGLLTYAYGSMGCYNLKKGKKKSCYRILCLKEMKIKDIHGGVAKYCVRILLLLPL